MTDICIIGGGPAGLTAALYAVRAGKSAIVFEKETPGGQIVYAPLVENYPALPHISGMEFAEQLEDQCTQNGVTIEYCEVTAVARDDDGFTVKTDAGAFRGKAVILACGAAHRHLGLENEEALIGSGVSYCAVCDGSFYADRDVAVAGGGDTALEEAIFLSGICRSVTLIHRRDTFRAQDALVRKALKIPNIRTAMDSVVEKLDAENGLLSAVTVRSKKTGEAHRLDVAALFIAVGQVPQTQAVRDLGVTDENGYIAADEQCITAVPGLFAAGDCRQKTVRQLTTAVGDGAVAALKACAYADA